MVRAGKREKKVEVRVEKVAQLRPSSAADLSALTIILTDAK